MRTEKLNKDSVNILDQSIQSKLAPKSSLTHKLGMSSSNLRMSGMGQIHNNLSSTMSKPLNLLSAQPSKSQLPSLILP